jgi:hypothetical protein
MKHHTSLIIAALLISVFAGCSKHPPAAVAPKITDLGVVEIASGTPIRHDLGGGKTCVISPTVTVATNKAVQGGRVTLIKMRMTIEQPDSSGIVQTQACPWVQAIAGEAAEWQVGDLDIRLTTKLKP